MFSEHPCQDTPDPRVYRLPFLHRFNGHTSSFHFRLDTFDAGMCRKDNYAFINRGDFVVSLCAVEAGKVSLNRCRGTTYLEKA
jgi:hypothetical protein